MNAFKRSCFSRRTLTFFLAVWAGVCVSAEPPSLAQQKAAIRPATSFATFAGVPWGTPRAQAFERFQHAGYPRVTGNNGQPLDALFGSVYDQKAAVTVEFEDDKLASVAVIWSFSDEPAERTAAFKARLVRELASRFQRPRLSEASPESAVKEYFWDAQRLELTFLDRVILLKYSGTATKKPSR